jgi:hypothetical protein
MQEITTESVSTICHWHQEFILYGSTKDIKKTFEIIVFLSKVNIMVSKILKMD